MQNSLLLCCCLLLIGVGELQAQSGVLWYADPNKSVNANFRRFDDDNPSPTSTCADTPSNQGSVSTPTDATYGKHWRITKPSTRKRAEFARMGPQSNPIVPTRGKTYYLGWRWRINGTPDLNTGVAVFQWKSAGSPNLQNYPFNLDYDGTTLSLNAYGPKQTNGGSINQWRTRLWSRLVKENQWITIVIGVKVSSDPKVGYIELWVNGSKQTLSNSLVQKYRATISSDGRRAYHRTFDGTEVYPKWGSYGGGACSFHLVSDFQDLRAATNYTDARPRPASSFLTQSGGDGNIPFAEGMDRAGDHSDDFFELYPNPVTRQLHLRRLPAGARQVTVLDMAGRRWAQTTLIPGTEQRELDTSGLPAGLYVLEVSFDEGSLRKRFVKQ